VFAAVHCIASFLRFFISAAALYLGWHFWGGYRPPKAASASAGGGPPGCFCAGCVLTDSADTIQQITACSTTAVTTQHGSCRSESLRLIVVVVCRWHLRCTGVIVVAAGRAAPIEALLREFMPRCTPEAYG
jgi:hypothetical protein